MNIRLIRASRGAGLGRPAGWGLLAGLWFALALCFGSCENPAGGNDDKAPAPGAQEAADSFFIAHSAILEKPADMLGLDDEAPVEAALAAYKGLNAETRSLLTTEKAHLDRQKVWIETLKNAAGYGLYYTAADLGAWLAEQPENTAADPYTVKYRGNEVIKTIYGVLEEAGRYAALDLSLSGVKGFSFGMEEGRAFIVSLVLPDTLTEIPGGTSSDPAFKGFTNLKTISATGVIHVGDYAFHMLATLTTVDLPAAETIGQYVFQRCTSLSSVNLPEALTIDMSAFSSCTGLATLSLPKTISLNGMVFKDCTSLATITLPELVTMNNGVFHRCGSLTGVDLPKAVSISNNAFNGCTSLQRVTAAEAATIESGAFVGCSSLATVSLPKATTIFGGAFNSCNSLTTVTLGTVPPVIRSLSSSLPLAIFGNLAVTPGKVITIDVPYPALYTSAGTPWSDKVNKTNTAAGYFWDNTAATRDNLTVNLQ